MINNLLSFASFLQTAWSIVVAILILLATITVHEFGHYIVGKIFKFKINEFAIGMGPAIYKKKKKNGEIFSIRIFPLGGYCAFEGEDEDEQSRKENEEKATKNGVDVAPSISASNGFSVKEEEKKPLSENAFNNKKPWQRILVLIAGASMNFIAAILVICLNFSIYGHFQLSAAEIKTSSDTSVEAVNMLETGDVITVVNGKYVYLTTDISSALNGKKKGDVVKVTVMHDGKQIEKEVKLVSDVNIESLSDYYPAFDALGIATVMQVGTNVESKIPDGAYIFRFNDAQEYENCTRIYTPTDLYERLKLLNVGDSADIYISTDGKTHESVTLTAYSDFEKVNKDERKDVLNYFGLKTYSLSYQLQSVNVRMSFFEVLYRSPAYAFKTVGITLKSFGELFTGKMSISQMSGPIGTIAITSQQVSRGFDYVLEMVALIGISVAVFNLLPIPALDGARAVFVLIEWIRKKPINRNVEATIHFVGLIVLIGFAIFVDVFRMFI